MLFRKKSITTYHFGSNIQGHKIFLDIDLFQSKINHFFLYVKFFRMKLYLIIFLENWKLHQAACKYQVACKNYEMLKYNNI